jgi:hypothetical protein
MRAAMTSLACVSILMVECGESSGVFKIKSL